MDIKAIDNQTNFKGVYSPRGVRFSDSQKKVIDDIKNKVNPNEDFFVEYGVRDNSIELFKLEGRTRDALDAEKTGWKKQLYIGTYSENYLFNLEDIENVKREQRKRDIGGILTGVLILGMMSTIILGYRKIAKTKDTIPVVKEQVVNPIKDSLQRVGKDTLDLTKQLIK